MNMIDESSAIDERRLVFPGLAGLYRRLAPLGYAFTRVAFAIVILPSGWEKVFEGGVHRIAAGNVLKAGFSPPLAWAWAVGCLEFFGVILLALGLFTRPVAFALAIQMAVITFLIQWNNGYFWTARGYEFALLLMLVCIAFVIGGGGRYSLDRKLGREF
jgi:putative oxidoreductase